MYVVERGAEYGDRASDCSDGRLCATVSTPSAKPLTTTNPRSTSARDNALARRAPASDTRRAPTTLIRWPASMMSRSPARKSAAGAYFCSRLVRSPMSSASVVSKTFTQASGGALRRRSMTSSSVSSTGSSSRTVRSGSQRRRWRSRRKGSSAGSRRTGTPARWSPDGREPVTHESEGEPFQPIRIDACQERLDRPVVVLSDQAARQFRVPLKRRVPDRGVLGDVVARDRCVER